MTGAGYHRTMVRTWVVMGFLAGLAFAPTVAAQTEAEGSQEARRHFETGTEAYDTGDYQLAVREFRAAHAITGHPDLLYNIYLATERAGRLEEAEQALAAYLEQAQIADDRRPALEQRLARLRARIEAAPEPTAPLPEPEAEPGPATTAPSADEGGVHPAAVALLATAGVLAVSFGVFAGLSEKEDRDLADRCGSDAGRTCTDDQVSTLRVYNAVADVSWIGAVATGAAGLTLLFVLRDDDGLEEPGVAGSAWFGGDGGGVLVRGRF